MASAFSIYIHDTLFINKKEVRFLISSKFQVSNLSVAVLIILRFFVDLNIQGSLLESLGQKFFFFFFACFDLQWLEASSPCHSGDI